MKKWLGWSLKIRESENSDSSFLKFKNSDLSTDSLETFALLDLTDRELV